MSAENPVTRDPHWYPLARSRSLGRKPLRRLFKGKPLVLFRTATGIACLHDICPHRFARLSTGCVKDGEIECPYHGWRFDGSGQCTVIPVHDGEVPRRVVPKLSVCEQEGLIFVCEDPQTPLRPHRLAWDGQPFVRVIIENETRTSLVNVGENVLDPTHTLFVHKGLMRGLTDKRSKVTITVTGTDERVDVRFDGEETQNGLVSRLLEGRRSHSTGSFRMPGIVEIEYWAGGKMSLANTLLFSPIDDNHQRGFAVLTAPRSWGLGWLKAALFIPLMRHIIKQDRVMMDEAHANWETFGRPVRAMSPTDFMRPNIEAILEGHRPPAADQPVRLEYRI